MAFRLALAAHLLCAWGATAVFWIPACASKGGPLHQRAGRLYVRLIYLTALTGAPLAVLLYADAPNAATEHTAIFLAYLLTILVVPVFHGTRVVRAARGELTLTSPLHTALACTAMAAGIVLCVLAIRWREWAYVLLSPVGFVIGARALHYARNHARHVGKWREEHMVAMMLSGIAVHTAALVFGLGRTLGITLTGIGSYVPWVLPAVVGLPLLLWQVRKDRARLSTSPSTVRTSQPR